MEQVSLTEIRESVANYMQSEIRYLQNTNKHRKNRAKLAELLSIPMYSDKSGFNFDKFATVPMYWDIVTRKLKGSANQMIVFPSSDHFIEFGETEDVIFHHYLNYENENVTDEVRKDSDAIEDLFRMI